MVMSHSATWWNFGITILKLVLLARSWLLPALITWMQTCCRLWNSFCFYTHTTVALVCHAGKTNLTKDKSNLVYVHISSQKPCGRQLNAKCAVSKVPYFFFFCLQQQYLTNGSTHRHFSTKLMFITAWSFTTTTGSPVGLAYHKRTQRGNLGA